MQETNFYKLRKPDDADFIVVEDLNYNADVLDQELNNLKNNSAVRISTTDEAFINTLTSNTGKVGQDYLFGSKGDKNGTISESLGFTLYQSLNNCVHYSGYQIDVVNLRGENEGLRDAHFKEPAYYLATFLESKKVAIRILTTPVEVIDNLTDGSTDKPISAAQGKWLNENKLTNKKRTLTAAELNNPNYPEPYVCSTDKGKEIGLPTSWAYIQYFRHENNDGYGTQVAYKLDGSPSGLENKVDKAWSIKIRTSNGTTWFSWENVVTSKEKWDRPVLDLNTCVEDGMSYYFNSSTANRPAMSDGIVTTHAYNKDNYAVTFGVQIAYSWWDNKVAMRSIKNTDFTPWKEILTSDNHAFSVDGNGIHMKGWDKKVHSRHIEGAMTPGLDGALFLNYHNRKPVYFKANDGSDHTLQEVFQSASNGKTTIANAITGKGIPTSTTASWQEMAGNIGKIASKLKTILIERFEENTSPPQYFRVEYGKSGFGSPNGEYCTRLVFTPPKPMRLVALELIRNTNNSERVVESIFFGGDWQETIGHLINGQGVLNNQHQAYCVPRSEAGTISTIVMSLNYDNEIKVDKLHVFRWLGVTSIKITYLE